jgi:hypothetical protein
MNIRKFLSLWCAALMLMGALFPCGIEATQTAWTGGTTKWSAAGIGATDTVTATGADTIDANASCGRFIKRSNTPLVGTGYSLTALYGIIIDSASILKFDKSLNWGASGPDTLHLGAGIGTATLTSDTVHAGGTAQLYYDDDKGTTQLTMTLDSASKVSAIGVGTNTFTGTGPCLLFKNGGTLGVNAAINLRPTGSCYPISIAAGTPTINGNNVLQVMIGANNLNDSIPALTIGGTTAFYVTNFGSPTGSMVWFMGKINTGINNFYFYNNASSALTYIFGSDSVICNALKRGAYAAGASATVKYGSGYWKINQFTYGTDLGSTTDSMQSVKIACTGTSGAWLTGTTHSIAGGASQITLTGAQNFTSNGKTYNQIYVNASGGTVTFTDTPTVAKLEVDAGAVSWNGLTVHVTDSMLISGAGINNFGNGINFGGKYLFVDSTIAAPICSLAVLKFQNKTQTRYKLKKSFNWLQMVLDTGAVVKFDSTSTMNSNVIAWKGTGAGTCPLRMLTGSSLYAYYTMFFDRDSAGPVFYNSGAYNLYGNNLGNMWFAGNAVKATDSVTVSFPKMRYDGSVVFVPSYFGLGYVCDSLTDSIYVPPSGNTAVGQISNEGYSKGHYVFKTNNNPITCNEYRIGNHNDTGSLSAYYGSSVMRITSYRGDAYDVGTNNDYLQSSTWYDSGSWNAGTHHTVTPATSTQNFLGTPALYGSTITPHGQAFGDMIFNGGRYTVSGNLTAKSISIVQHSADVSGDTVTLTGDLTIAAGCSLICNGASKINVSGAITNNGYDAGCGLTAVLTVTQPAHGSIAPTTETVNCGTPTTVTQTLVSGWLFKNWHVSSGTPTAFDTTTNPSSITLATNATISVVDTSDPTVAVAIIWSANAPAQFGVAGNWSLLRVPGKIDTARFNATSAQACSVLTVRSVGAIKMDAGAGLLYLGPQRDTVAVLTANAGTLQQAGDTLCITGDPTTGAGLTLTSTAATLWRILTSGATLAVNGNSLPAVQAGTVSLAGGGTIAQIIPTADDTISFEPYKHWYITSIPTTTWDGTSGHLKYFITPTLGQACTLSTPAYTASYGYYGGIVGDSIDAAFSRHNVSRGDNK